MYTDSLIFFFFIDISKERNPLDIISVLTDEKRKQEEEKEKALYWFVEDSLNANNVFC